MVRDADLNNEDYDEYGQVNSDTFVHPVQKKPKVTPAIDWSEKMTKSVKVLRKELMEKTKSQEQEGTSPKAVFVESYPPIPKPPALAAGRGQGSEAAPCEAVDVG